jgi:penicillin-binding protein 1C
VADVPTDFATSTGLFSPVNYDRHCYGPVRYRVALANSLNISAVKVLDSLGGAKPLLDLLRRCRLSTLTHADDYYGLGLAIGNAEARLLELANAYACLARLGVCRPYRLVPSARGQDTGERVGDADAAWLIADILSDNDARAEAFGPESSLRFDFPVACKTGTSSDFRDNWAFGYTPEFTVGVWVGNFDGSPMRHISGVTGAAPILHDLFDYLHDQYGTSWYARPADIVDRGIDPLTGKLSSRPDAVNEKFIAHVPAAFERGRRLRRHWPRPPRPGIPGMAGRGRQLAGWPRRLARHRAQPARHVSVARHNFISRPRPSRSGSPGLFERRWDGRG